MSKNSFALAAVIAATTFTAVPAFASPDHAQAPVAMSSTRQPAREVPVVERQDRNTVTPTTGYGAAAPVTTVVIQKSGFSTQPVATDGVFGFGVHVSADEATSTRFGFAQAGSVTKVGFASVR